MSLFESHEKHYFVFAGEGDRYFLDSMIQLDTKKYLWFELKCAQYDSVYFIDCADRNYTIKALDESSVKRYNASCIWPSYSKPKIMPGRTTTEIEAERLRKWIAEIMVKNCNTPAAAVFSLNAFCTLYADIYTKKHLDKLIERPKNQNSVIIQAPMRLSPEQHGLLIDKKGVFAYATQSDQSFCPELRAAVLSKSPVPALELLKQRLGARMIELDAVTYERMKSFMRCVRFQRKECWTEEELLQYTNILYRWWYLDEINRTAALHPRFLDMWENFCYKERNRTDFYAALYDNLCSDSGWYAFQERVHTVLSNRNANSENQFLSALNRRPAVEGKCHVTLDDAILRDIARIPWPENIYSTTVKCNPAIHGASRERWISMQESLQIPGNRLIPTRRLNRLSDYFRHYKEALANKDYETVCRAINAMLFLGTNLVQESDEFDYDQRMEEYSKCLGCSKAYFEIQNSYSGAETDSAAAKRWALSQIMMKERYRYVLEVFDYNLKITPQMTQKLDVEEIRKAAQKLASIADSGHETYIKAEDAKESEMSSEEADRWLREKYGKNLPC